MELEFATTADIVRELRDRRMRFVLIGVENTNRDRESPVFLAGQAGGPEELVRLIELGRQALTTLDDDFTMNDGELPDDAETDDSSFFSEFNSEVGDAEIEPTDVPDLPDDDE